MALGGEAQLPERINEELLSCTICFGTYSLNDKLPKLLPCSHTFCIECIEEYLKNQGRNGTPKGKFLCPVCRKENTLPKNGIPDLPNNITVVGLLDLVKDSGLNTEVNSSPNDSATVLTQGQSLYPSLPADIEPYIPPVTHISAALSDNSVTVDLPVVEADPDKCYECGKNKPSLTLKCGHSICKQCKKSRQISKASQSSTMCPLCTDLQAAAMLVAAGGSVAPNIEESTVNMETSPTEPSAPEPTQKVDSPMEADRPPSFNPEYATTRQTPAKFSGVPVLPVNTPTRSAPPPPKPQRAREASPLPPKATSRESSPRGTNTAPLPPPRRLPGEIIGSPLKCIKKIGSYSEVRMQTNAFKSPTRLSMYQNGNFIVVDQEMMTVQVFNSKGDYVSLFKAIGVQGACFFTADKMAVATHRGIDIYNINGAPTGKVAPGNLDSVVSYRFGFIAISPKSLAIYGQDLSITKEIKKKVKPGVFQRGSVFESIQDVAVNSQNDIAVLDSKAGEIYLMNEEGLIKLTFTPSTESCGALKDPYSIAFDRYNNLYVSDTGNKRVLKFYANGRFARCVLNFSLGNPTQKEMKTTVYGIASGDENHIIVALSGDKTAEVRLYEV